MDLHRINCLTIPACICTNLQVYSNDSFEEAYNVQEGI